MDIQELKYFCAVASEGSLSKAAQKLHYAQSNLSTKIIQLEQEIGCPLFYRNNHGVTLTTKGELLLKYATNLINLAEEAVIAVKDDTTAQGMLKIGSMESTVITYLSDFLTRFHAQNPQVTVQAETGTTDHVLQKVLGHRLDGAFVAGPIRHPELFTKQVRTEKLCLIGSKNLVPDHDVERALTQPLLVFPSGCSYRKTLEQWIKDQGLVAGKIYEFNTLSGIFASVSAGLGVAMFPESCVERYSRHDALTVLDIPEKYALVPTVFVYRKDRFLSGAMCSFIHAISAPAPAGAVFDPPASPADRFDKRPD